MECPSQSRRQVRRRDLGTGKPARRADFRQCELVNSGFGANRTVFVDFFIQRPVFATVCALLLILGGAIAIPTLPIAQFPELAPPQVVVSSGYIGANAQTVESAVTIPLEQAINGVPGMKYMTSASGNDGTSEITVVFDVTRDVDLASVDVQNRVNQALGRLPNDVKNTGVIITKQASGFILGAGAYTEGQYDSMFLSNY